MDLKFLLWLLSPSQREQERQLERERRASPVIILLMLAALGASIIALCMALRSWWMGVPAGLALAVAPLRIASGVGPAMRRRGYPLVLAAQVTSAVQVAVALLLIGGAVLLLRHYVHEIPVTAPAAGR